jgi:hypothetical protein
MPTLRKVILVTICVIALLSLSVAENIPKVKAATPEYSINNHLAKTVPVIDGNWTTNDEWTDAEERELIGTRKVYFRLKHAFSGGTSYEYILIDFVSDFTDDAGDLWQLCFDAHDDNSTSPQRDDCRIIQYGHILSGVHVYKGDGTGWVETSNYAWDTDLMISNNMSTSPHLAALHWIVEFKINATWLDLHDNYALRVAAMDAHGGGNQAWPGSTINIPNDWGQTITKFVTIPEFQSILAVLMMLMTLVVTLCLPRRCFSARRSTPEAS